MSPITHWGKVVPRQLLSANHLWTIILHQWKQWHIILMLQLVQKASSQTQNAEHKRKALRACWLSLRQRYRMKNEYIKRSTNRMRSKVICISLKFCIRELQRVYQRNKEAVRLQIWGKLVRRATKEVSRNFRVVAAQNYEKGSFEVLCLRTVVAVSFRGYWY